MHAHMVKREMTAPAKDSLTHQHHQREWRQGRGKERVGRDWEGMQDRHAERPIG